MKVTTKDEKSLLLFLECRAVDDFGKVNTHHMNKDDMVLAAKWNDASFIKFGRIPADKIVNLGLKMSTHYVILTDEAYTAAARLRRERGKRNEPTSLVKESRHPCPVDEPSSSRLAPDAGPLFQD